MIYRKHLVWISLIANLITITLFLLASLSILTGWFKYIENNWLIVIFKLHIKFDGINVQSLSVFNYLDILIMFLVFIISIALYINLEPINKSLATIGLVIPLLGIIVFIMTHEAGRASVFLWGLIFSTLMLRSRLFTNITGYVGISASLLLFIGDIGLEVMIHPLFAIFTGIGYILLVWYLLLVNATLLKLIKGELLIENFSAVKDRDSNNDSESLFSLTKGHIKQACEVSGRAFHNYPTSLLMFPDEAERRKKLPHGFEMIYRYGIKNGEVYATSKNLEGITVWLPPNKVHQSIWSMVKYGGIQVMLNSGLKALKRGMPIYRHIDSAHKRLAPFDHWYLQSIVVEPEKQGKGHGSYLMRSMINKVRDQSIPIYLETHNEENMYYYQKFGFEILEHTIIAKTNVPIWCLLKKFNS